MKNHEKLIVFTRYPEPGKTKTRLSGALGPIGAADVHKQMTAHAVGIARQLKVSMGTVVEIRFSGGNDSRMRQWLGSDLEYAEQAGDSLGERINNAFLEGFEKGYERIVLMGSDCPGVTVDILKEAFRILETQSGVLGPAADGGYYLIGLKQIFSQIFEDISWGTDRVLHETLQVFADYGVLCAMLKQLHDVDIPQDLPVWENICRQSAGSRALSIIIPALNESTHIQEVIEIANNGIPNEIIVVDGGSSDDTVERAKRAGAVTIQASQGRALQMNAGARIARGNHLLFLHADTRLADGYSVHIQSILSRSIAGGAFRFAFSQPFSGSKLIEYMTNLRAVHLQLPYGDQAIFVRKRDFMEMGGYSPIPIMEDFDFVMRLKRRGPIVIADAPAHTSGRKWHQLGLLRTTLIHQWMIAGYFCGVDPVRLAACFGNVIRRWSKR